MKYLIIVLLLFSSSAHSDGLDKYRLLLGLQVVIDYNQTDQIVKSSNSYESNKCMGKHPSKQRQNTCFIASYAVVVGASYLLPIKFRKPLLIASNVIQISYVSSNWVAGFSIKI